MAALDNKKEIEILFWANLNPNKRGSFEDYICHLASKCRVNRFRIKFALGNQINDSLRKPFRENSVDYFPLPSMELNSICTMIRVLKNFKPKIIHLHFIGLGSPLVLACKLMGVRKIILTEHASTLVRRHLGNGSMLEPLKRIKTRFFAGEIDHFVAVSNFVAGRLRERSHIPHEKITVIYNGVDLARFRPPSDELKKMEWKRRFFDADESVSVVTFIGQLTEEKGLLVYLESIQRLLRSHDDILFNFVGAGPLENLLLHTIKQPGNNMMRFLGLRDDAEDILKASDIVVVPSVWEEAFGLVIAEASACGVPVIGSRIGGIPEVLLDQETGILTTPADVDELVRGIERLLYDRNLRKYFSDTGRKHAENNFDLQIQVSETVKLYRQCLVKDS